MAQVFGSDLASISLGDSAEVLTGIDSKNFSGRVDNISSLLNPDTRSVIVPDADGKHDRVVISHHRYA